VYSDHASCWKIQSMNPGRGNGTRITFTGIRCLWHDHPSLSSSTEFKNEQNHTTFLLVYLHNVNRDKCTFLFSPSLNAASHSSVFLVPADNTWSFSFQLSYNLRCTAKQFFFSGVITWSQPEFWLHTLTEIWPRQWREL